MVAVRPVLGRSEWVLFCRTCVRSLVLHARVPEDRVTAVLEAAAEQAKAPRLPWPPRAGDVVLVALT